MNIPLHHITASVIAPGPFDISVFPFRGIAFRDPQSGHWCALRTGLVIAEYLGDELTIHHSRPVRETWQRGLMARIPSRCREVLQQAA